MKKTVLLLCLIALFLSGCGGVMNMRKISVEPKISTENMKKSSLKAGLLLNDQFTNYKYVFDTGPVLLLLMSNMHGEIEIGKNLSHALYGIVSSKFRNIAIAHDISEIQDVDIYFVPRIKSFTYSPATHGYSSFTSTVELETEVFDKNGLLLRTISIKQEGSRHILSGIYLHMETNYEMASYAVNESINNTLNEFSRKLNEFY